MNQQLDAQVAERVMGWKPLPKTGLTASMGGKYYCKSNSTVHEWLDDFGPNKTYWNPTTDPAQALEVLRKISRGRELTIQIAPNGTTAAIGEVHQDDTPEGLVSHVSTITTAPTLEEAICRAALILTPPEK